MELVDISLSHFLEDSPKITIPMYVCMQCIEHVDNVSSQSMRVHILQLGKDRQRRSRVNSNCSSPKQEPVRQHSQPARYSRERLSSVLITYTIAYISVQVLVITIMLSLSIP